MTSLAHGQAAATAFRDLALRQSILVALDAATVADVGRRLPAFFRRRADLIARELRAGQQPRAALLALARELEAVDYRLKTGITIEESI